MKIFLLSSMGTTVHLNLYYTGLEYTSPTVGSALSNVMPSLTTLIAVVLGMETMKLGSNRGKAKLFGTLVCIGGSLIFTFCKGKRLFTSFKQKPLVQLYDTEGESRNHKENWVKGALLILISEVALSARIILQGVVISALVYWLQTWCISKKGRVFAAMFSPLILVIVGIFSAIVFAERLYLGSLVGALLIVFGLYCVLWGKKHTEKPCTSRRGYDDDKILDIPVDNSTVMAPIKTEQQMTN
ncbi:WAT1-related At1g43650-like isoform X1 [Olea europaea subsp. europaea]|uniref:WAT1-related protein n=1 Tax=Olea europaea subsp. europaea TaxID=158383 RepID=A0A8S0QIA6_OLEEU|nr:WAT1-related At1g43650-like isoform X1 [Olea europaea subsp. europaea]